MKPTKPIAEGREATSLALIELLAAKDEVGSIKRRAFGELKKLSRSFVGLALLADDLGAAADLDEALVAVRHEHNRLCVERDGLNSAIAELQTTEQAQRARVTELTAQAEQLSERVAELDRERRELEPTVQSYRALEAAIASSQQRLDELRTEEARLRPIIAEHRDIERRLPERQQALSDIERRLASIRASIGN